mmetsp:Transcript_87746/g.209695  ORF Transcript_87746/g.209695 Transcript_87746/m.209695 type:complete len:405 (-) Transcript_87746:113-1327(-)
MKLAAHSSGDGAAQRGLADARRTVETKDGALEVASHLLDRQELQDPHLDLLEAAVVVVQHPAGLLQVEVVLGAGLPWKAGQELQVAVYGGVLRVVRLKALQALQLLLGQLLRLLRQLSLGEPLAEAGHLVLIFGAFFAVGVFVLLLLQPLKLLLDLLRLTLQGGQLHLLISRPLDAFGDLRRHPLRLRLSLEKVQRQAEPLLQVRGLQDLLALLDGQRHQGGTHHACQECRVGGEGQPPVPEGRIVHRLLRQQLCDLLLNTLHQRPHHQRAVVAGLLQELHRGHVAGPHLRNLQHLEASPALDAQDDGHSVHQHLRHLVVHGLVLLALHMQDGDLRSNLEELRSRGLSSRGAQRNGTEPLNLALVQESLRLLEGLLRHLHGAAKQREHHLVANGHQHQLAAYAI